MAELTGLEASRDWREDKGAAAAAPEVGFIARETWHIRSAAASEILLMCWVSRRSDIKGRAEQWGFGSYE
jgi:hypothetical protein